MAKKKKQKKAGLAKRQTSKQHKKNAQKRKLQAQKPVQKKISASKIKQNLKNLPSLVFEPELLELAFDPDDLKQAIENHENLPDQIEAVASPDFMEKLKAKHEEMKVRFDRENDVNKSMMAHAIIYFMEQENAPAYLNQIVVCMFYQAQQKLTNPDEPVTLKDLNQYLKNYDKEWGDYLQEKMAELEGPVLPTEEAIANEEPDEELEITPSEFEPLLEEFEAYLSGKEELSEEVRERTQEDVEVLVNDYFEDKEITQLADMRARKIRSFIESWFVRNMNPTREDLELMINSLLIFYQFIAETEKIEASETDAIIELLKDKDSLLTNIDL